MQQWVLEKDPVQLHECFAPTAQRIQQMCLDYWLAQRIKAPQDAAGKERYLGQLAAMHGIIVAAMKCKQTTDLAHVEKIRALALAFSESYFSPEDLEHIREHHAGDH